MMVLEVMIEEKRKEGYRQESAKDSFSFTSTFLSHCTQKEKSKSWLLLEPLLHHHQPPVPLVMQLPLRKERRRHWYNKLDSKVSTLNTQHSMQLIHTRLVSSQVHLTIVHWTTNVSCRSLRLAFAADAARRSEPICLSLNDTGGWIVFYLLVYSLISCLRLLPKSLLSL